ncbi:hypothetical protein WR25_14321 isoform B [Diploscapter pachys]|nr:hypothetical protein WR25_14321 isoform B [Diploscapter pachys]
MYQPQQQSYGYQSAATNNTAAAMGAWSQPQQTQMQQYSMASYPTDMASYAEKVGGGGNVSSPYYDQSDMYRVSTYGNPQGAVDSTGYYSQQTQAQQQQQQQQQAAAAAWGQQSYSAYPSQQQIYGGYTTGMQQQNRGGSSYNHSATGATQQGQAPPMNMSRPPPLLKRNDNQDSAFSLAMLENPAQSAAAYTASWVSSTSSIPPDLKEEPDRDDMFASHIGAFGDQFSSMSLHDKDMMHQWDSKTPNATSMMGSGAGPTQHGGQPQGQWPGLDNSGHQGLGQQHNPGVIGNRGPMNKKREENRRSMQQEDAAELTWEERVKKAALQKARAEQKGDRSEGGGGGGGSGGGYVSHRGGRGGMRGGPNQGNSPRGGFSNRGERKERPNQGEGHEQGGQHNRNWNKPHDSYGQHQNGDQSNQRLTYRGRNSGGAPNQAGMHHQHHQGNSGDMMHGGAGGHLGGQAGFNHQQGAPNNVPYQYNQMMMGRGAGGSPYMRGAQQQAGGPAGMVPGATPQTAGIPQFGAMPLAAQTQDKKFQNTWLDANAFMQPPPFPIPPYSMQFPGGSPFGGAGGPGGQFRGRGRGRGGRGGQHNNSGVGREQHNSQENNGTSGANQVTVAST